MNKNTLIKEFEKYLNDNKKYSIKTIREYLIDIKTLLEFVEKYSPNTPILSLINNNKSCVFLAYDTFLREEKGISNTTLLRKRCSWRVFLQFIHELTSLPLINIDNELSKIKAENKEQSILTREEIKRILNAILNDTTKLQSRNICIFNFLIHTGIRTNELCEIKLDDINLLYKTVIINGKGRKKREVFLNEALNSCLEKYLEFRKMRKSKEGFEEYLFLSSIGQKLSNRGVQKIVEKYSKLANINKNITPKSFRHSFATLKYENNINYSTIAEMLGHNNISTTGIYVHTKCQDLKQAFMKEII